MKNVIGWLMVVCFFVMAKAYAGDNQSVSVSEQIIVNAKWGNKSGEIGNVPLDPKDQTAGESINPIALDKTGNIYVGDPVNSRIMEFNSKGEFVFEFKFPYKFHLLEDIFVDDNNRVYALIEPANLKIIIFNPMGTIESIIDISNIGRLEDKKRDGKAVLNKDIPFGGTKLLVNADGTIFIQGGDLIKINKAGDVVNRIGPYVDSFFVDTSGVVYVLYIYGRGGEVDQYDKNLKFLRTGWGIYKDILWPEKSDSLGNVYGFAFNAKTSQGSRLKKYNAKKSISYQLPLGNDKLAVEHWAVDGKGNIYYSDSAGQKFMVYKLSLMQ